MMLKILIVKLSAIGDVIHALPVASALRGCYPDAQLTWVVERPAYDVLANNPDIDEIIIFDKPNFKSLKGILANAPDFVGNLRRYKFDIAIDLQGLFKSSAIAWLSGAKRRFVVNHAREGSWLLCRRVDGSFSNGHIVERYLDVVRVLGCEVDEPKFVIEFTDDEQVTAADLLHRQLPVTDKLAILAPGANWPNKRWPPVRFAELIRLLQVENWQTLIVGGPGDRGLCDEIARFLPIRPAELIGRTSLKQLAWIIAQAAVFVGGDTGPTHLAVALGTPTVELLGPTDDNRNGPYGEKNIGLEVRRDCAGCWRRSCPKGRDCLDVITAGEVVQSVRKVVSGL